MKGEEVTYRRVRILLKVKDAIKSFYWVEMKDYDLYWGCGSKSKFTNKSQLVSKGSRSTTIQIDDIKDAKNLTNITSTKYSYHKSGEIHEKDMINGKYHSLVKRKPIDDIPSPILFFSVLSKEIRFYDNYNRKFTKGNANALIINFSDENMLKNIIYMEFFLTRDRRFSLPKMLFFDENSKENVVFQRLNNSYVLVLRYVACNSPFSKIDCGNVEMALITGSE
jgi:hypothetical protein